MQNGQYKKIEDLLERFFDGQTSNEEEQELYGFFAGPDVPEHLAPYKPVFDYFETGIVQELAAPDKEKVSFASRFSLKRWGWVVAGAAASLLLFLVYSSGSRQPAAFNPYEGSYIVRNGVRITNMETILPVLEMTVREVEDRQEHYLEMACRIRNKEKQAGEIEQGDSVLYHKIVEKIPDEHIRREILNTLYFQ